LIALPRLKARQILGDLGIDRPELLRHLKEICCVRGAFVREEDLQSCEGRLVIHGDRGIITVRASGPYAGRIRFSIAHELGHFELHRGLSGSFDCSSVDMNAYRARQRSVREQRENEANQFAAELLIPERFLGPAISGRRPELGLLKDLARDFGVSLTAACHRFAELTDESCAFVFSRGGQLLHSWKSRPFALGRYWISPGALGSGGSKGAARRSDGLRPVEARDWLELSSSSEDVPLYGQTEHFRNLGFSLTLLWIDPAEGERQAVRSGWACERAVLRPLSFEGALLPAALEAPLSG
jgi:Zn-dependent peptidase ImmA (M78 family)